MADMYNKYIWLKKQIKKLIPASIFKKLVNYYHLLEALYANIANGWPARSMKFIGITGTNGKTSTSYMVAKIMEHSGYKVGLNSTAIIKVGNSEVENKLDGGLTNASTFTTQKLLSRMKKSGVQWVAMECGSQGLDQHRVWGIKFASSIITNLTNEHLDYHGTMENYAKAKAILFKNTKGANVVNGDDEWADYFKSVNHEQSVIYGKKSNADYRIVDIKHTDKTTIFKFSFEGKDYSVTMRVQGEFNVYNALAAIAATHTQGVDITNSIEALESIDRIPGRMDNVDAGQNFRVLVDYAHTPDAIENVLHAAKDITKGKLICVTGAAGERPISRRAPVGKIANEICDYLFVTDDEPFGENPDKIRSEIFQGIKKGKNTAIVEEIADRWDAISKACSMASSGDTIVVAGMGHQKYRSGPKGKEKWDDYKIAFDILSGKKTNSVNDNWRKVINNSTIKD